MLPYLIFGLAALTATLAVSLFLYSGRREQKEDVQLRLRAGDESVIAADILTEAKRYNRFIQGICHALWRAGIDVKPATAIRILVVIGIMIPLTLLVLGWAMGAIVIGVALVAGYFVLSGQAARRRSRIVEQLPGFLEAVIRVLTSGNTLEEAFSAAARESEEPSRTLFLSISRQVRLGAPIDTVLAEMSQIHRIRDLRVIALATNINRRYGGTLRNVFRSLIQAIRMREAAARELKALTAETRFSAMVLAGLPIGISIFIFLRNRGFYTDILATTSGRMTMLVGVLLQVAGVLIIWRMMKSTQGSNI